MVMVVERWQQWWSIEVGYSMVIHGSWGIVVVAVNVNGKRASTVVRWGGGIIMKVLLSEECCSIVVRVERRLKWSVRWVMAQGMNVKGRAYANELLCALREGKVMCEVNSETDRNKDLPKSPGNACDLQTHNTMRKADVKRILMKLGHSIECIPLPGWLVYIL